MDSRKFMENYLSHAYDPAKAKEYYERTKKLKGRKPGEGKTPTGRPPAAGLAPTKTPPKAKAAPAPKGANRTAVLNARLGRLNEILDLLDSKVAAAQARSGVTGVKKAAATKKTADSKEPSKAKTGTEKKEAAKAAADRYEKNKTSETSKGAQAVQDEIEEVQKKIAEARDELKAALVKARASSPKPKTVPKSRPTEQSQKQGGPSK